MISSSREDRKHQRILRNNQVRIIQKVFRSNNNRFSVTFMINPYDRMLDPSDKDDRKLFEVGSEGLVNEDKFDGKAENAQRFLKLIRNRTE